VKQFNIILVIVILLGAVVLSTMGSGTVRDLKSGFLSLVSPFLKTGDAVGRQIGSVGEDLKTLDRLEEENRTLTLENRQLKTTNQLLRDLEAENQKLRQALDYRERSVFQLLPARIIARDSSTWWKSVKINRGFEDGVESDMPVLTESGLVGKTTTVGKNESVVILVTDESCRVAAKVEGTTEKGIASGFRVSDAASLGDIQLAFLSKSANLQPGQKVYSAGVSGGVFPSGILVGEVKSFRVRPLDGQAVLAPAVELDTIEDVFVLVGAK